MKQGLKPLQGLGGTYIQESGMALRGVSSMPAFMCEAAQAGTVLLLGQSYLPSGTLC